MRSHTCHAFYHLNQSPFLELASALIKMSLECKQRGVELSHGEE
jgi:hypothetical protein